MLRRACVKNKLEDKLPRGIFSEFRLDWFPPYNRPKGGTIGTRDKEPSAAGADGFRFREAICPKVKFVLTRAVSDEILWV